LKSIFKSLDYIAVIKYICYFALFLLFNNIESNVYPYSIALLAVLLFEGASIIATPILFLSAFILTGNVGLLGSGAISAGILLLIACLYKKFNGKIRFEICAYVALSLLGYVFLGDSKSPYDIEKRILVSILTTALSFFCLIGGRTIVEKGLKFKPSFEEYLSVALLLCVCGIGACNLVSPLFWRTVCVLFILLICYLYRTGIGTLVSAVLGISLAIYYRNVSFVSVLLVWAVLAECLMPVSRYVSAISVIVSDYAIQLLFSFYPVYTISLFLSIVCGVAIFCLIPSKPLKTLKERLYSFREKQLVRQTINRNRVMLAGRLYDLSGVFSEMSNAFTTFNKSQPQENQIKQAMKRELLTSACKQCENYERCLEFEENILHGLDKMIDIGFAKGKLSLIDLSREVGAVCLKPNNILYTLNKLLAEHRTRLIDNANVKSGRDLIASEALGVAEILRGLALESGSQLKFHSRVERALSEALFNNGILVSELLIYGEENFLSVSLIVVMKEFSIDCIASVISKTLGRDMSLVERAEISDGKCYLSFSQSAPFEAVFGVARAVKDGSEASGDTHAVTRVGNDCFLVALSDGMGSGKEARNISSTSLSLIESFYKARLNSSLILNTVNKLLAINAEDSFTALDVSVIDLKDCSADFIKYGAPYGFIVGDKGVKIVEGNSLPLGILEELKPSVCHTNLSPDDIIVLVTDGISDVFGSSGDIIDFLRTVPAKNPQTLADALLSRAIELGGGKKADDMTVLAVRVYQRNKARQQSA